MCLCKNPACVGDDDDDDEDNGSSSMVLSSKDEEDVAIDPKEAADGVNVKPTLPPLMGDIATHSIFFTGRNSGGKLTRPSQILPAVNSMHAVMPVRIKT